MVYQEPFLVGYPLASRALVDIRMHGALEDGRDEHVQRRGDKRHADHDGNSRQHLP